MNVVIKIVKMLSPEELKKLPGLVGLMFFMALLDAIGVASIMPFIAVVADHNIIYKYEFVSQIFLYFGVVDKLGVVLLSGSAIFTTLIFTNCWKAFTTYYIYKFSFSCEYSLSKQLIELYLRQPYSWFLSKNSADLGKNILSEVNTVVSYGLIPAANFLAQVMLGIALLGILLFVDAVICLTVVLVFSIICGVLFKLSGPLLVKTANDRMNANADRFNVVKECFSLIKPIKLSGLVDAYVSEYEKPAKIYAHKHSMGLILTFTPRYAIETFAFGGMILCFIILIARGQSIQELLSIIAIYAFAGIRLLPAAQQIYASIASFKFSGPPVDALFDDFERLAKVEISSVGLEAQQFKTEIKFDKVSYKYPNASELALSEINIGLYKNEIIGLVGVSGSGKSTFVDLLLGLLSPTSGQVKIDGISMEHNSGMKSQHFFGYVPQNFYISDNTILKNIAFGVADSDIDMGAIERASRAANLHEFVTKKLPEGYRTIIGEDGVRLSGGQRQRISIARALYHDPEFIIFDEATNSLDSLSEKSVMTSISNLKSEKTILIVSHRLNTLRRCDRIILMSKGQIVEVNNYEHLRSTNETFKALASDE